MDAQPSLEHPMSSRALLLVSTILSLGVASTALAAHGYSGTTPSLVSQLYVFPEHGTHVKLETQTFPSAGTSGCAALDAGQTQYFVLSASDPQYAILHSTLMAAYAANKKVTFYWDGCGGQDGKYPRVKSIWVSN
jgi:hypothetical protein